METKETKLTIKWDPVTGEIQLDSPNGMAAARGLLKYAIDFTELEPSVKEEKYQVVVLHLRADQMPGPIVVGETNVDVATARGLILLAADYYEMTFKNMISMAFMQHARGSIAVPTAGAGAKGLFSRA